VNTPSERGKIPSEMRPSKPEQRTRLFHAGLLLRRGDDIASGKAEREMDGQEFVVFHNGLQHNRLTGKHPAPIDRQLAAHTMQRETAPQACHPHQASDQTCEDCQFAMMRQQSTETDRSDD
jgi:hypothetical protein